MNNLNDAETESEILEVLNKIRVTSGLEKAVSISIDQKDIDIEKKINSITIDPQKLENSKECYKLNPEIITKKNGEKNYFRGSVIDYPKNFKSWNKKTQDNWKNAVRNEAIRNI